MALSMYLRVVTEQRCLSEYDAKRRLSEYMIRVNREQLADTPASAVAAAEQLGYPCVLKLSGAEITHKTELGGVRLGLTNADAVHAAAVELLNLPPTNTQLLVAEQVHGNRELIAGVTQDPVFGPALMFGLGGIFAEVMADVVFRLLPADRDDVESMLEDLGNQAILGEFRGAPAVDRASLVDSLVGLSDCALANDDIESIDINPFVVNDAGVPVAVDALVVLR